MENINRASYGAAADKLAAYAASADVQQIAATGEDILAVADLLRRERRLRRALADPGRSGADHAALLHSVLEGKVGDEALDILETLVTGRWSGPGALLDGVELLGVTALLSGVDRAGELGEVEDELFRFGQVVSGDSRLAAALADSSSPLDARVQLISDLLKGKAKPATLRLAGLAAAGFGGRGFESSLTRLIELAAKQRDHSVAYVTTAVPLTEADEQRLAGRLAQLYGRQVSLKVDVDPRVIGGVRVKVGSDLYDGTVSRRLAEAKTALAN